MDRKKLKSKYGMSLEPPVASVTDKQLTPAVVKLREFILTNRRHGIHLVIKDGRPALRFVPGLNKGNTERWDACLAAEVLLFKAATDLMRLIDERKIDLDDWNQNSADPVQLQAQLFKRAK